MRKFRTYVVLCCVVPVMALLCSCSGGGGGGTVPAPNLSIQLTDSPGDYLKVYVTISGIYAIIEGSEPLPLEFADFDSPAVVEETPDSFTVDLIQLADGNSIEIAFGNLPEGRLNQLRLIVNAAELYAFEDVVQRDGPDPGNDISHVEAWFEVKVPSGPQTGIKLNPRDVDVESGVLTSLTLDFDADKSIVKLGPPHKPKKKDPSFVLKPVIFILEAAQAIPVETVTEAVNLDFPTGVDVAENVGPGSVIPEGNVLVANAGTSNTVLAIDPLPTTPIDATTLTPFASSTDTDAGGEAYVNAPSGVVQYTDLVWIANMASVVAADSAGTVTEIYTDGTLSTIYIDNDPPTDSVAGLVETSGIEFGGFAPDGSLSGYEYLVFQTNGNGSITGLNVKDSLIFDILLAGSFASPSDAVFVPASIAAGDPEGTVLGWLHVTDAGADELVMLELSVAGGPIGAPGTGIAVSSQSTFTYPFMSQPIGIAYSTMTGYLYIGNRGNGTVIAVDESTGAEIATFDTGLGADAINGIDVYAAGAGDVVFFTNTAANTLEKFEAAN